MAETFITERRLGQTPFSQVGFNLDSLMPPVDLQWTIKQYEIDNGAAKLDLLMGLEEKPKGLTGYIEYNADLFEAATIERIIENFKTLIESVVANQRLPISELPLQIESKSTSTYPLASSQCPVWFEQTLRPNQAMLNIGGYTRINGQIHPAVFEKALNRVIEDNDALRIIICKKNNQPTQKFAENIIFRLDFHDFSQTKNAGNNAIKWMEQELVKPFQLYNEPLFRFALCKASDTCYYWLHAAHHIIIDGWGFALMAHNAWLPLTTP
ncbi:MAG: hypothetical protein JRJ49_02550 [Deltaproteobacteria bacterium]|nr:hypothetical protein [Deltaproteobacteria bacterium]